jgi:predicted TIM-barrel fold metal-dependent hydrolase
MIVDAHVLVGKSIHGYQLFPEDLLANMDRYGIDRSVICPVQPYTYHLEPENDYIAQVVKDAPDRFIGFCRVDPRQGTAAVSEVERSVKELHLLGVYLHPWEEGYRANADFVVPVIEKAAERQVPVMIATGYPWVSHALQVADLAGRVPAARIIMTHGGQINISGLAQADAFLAMSGHDNLYLETSGVYRQDFLEDAIETFGAGRVLFGSNSPRMHQGFELDRAKSATVLSGKQYEVLGDSVLTLLGLGG